MRDPSFRFTVRRLLIAVAVVALVAVPARWIWRSQGGILPSLSGLRVGMTRAEVESLVGPPSSERTWPDGTTQAEIQPEESFVWVVLEYDTDGRLRRFWRGGY